jgi:SAM-dependent methyltransferase
VFGYDGRVLSTPIIRFVHGLRYRPERRSIAADVERELGVARVQRELARQWNIDLSNAHILEVGPGLSFAVQLAFAGYGARVAVADRFLARWHPGYHPRFYRAFRETWDGPGTAIDKVIAADGYPRDVIACIDQPAEQSIRGLDGRQFDFVFSNAVLEHVSDLRSVCRALAGVTKPGGLHAHQIDFNDHLDRAHPLEFLTRGNIQFMLEKVRHPSQGNRLRLTECISSFENAGFRLEAVVPINFADDRYMADFLPRLRASKSRYCNWPASDLHVLSARLFARRL